MKNTGNRDTCPGEQELEPYPQIPYGLGNDSPMSKHPHIQSLGHSSPQYFLFTPGKLLRRVKSLLSDRIESQKSKFRSKHEEELTVSTDTVTVNGACEMDSNESFHSFVTVEETEKMCRDGQIGTFIPPDTNCLRGHNISTRGPHAQDSAELIARVTSKDVNCHSREVIHKAFTPTMRLQIAGSNSECTPNFAMSSPQLTSSRRMALKGQRNLHGNSTVRRDRARLTGRIKRGRPSKLKARALGRVTPAGGSEDLRKNLASMGPLQGYSLGAEMRNAHGEGKQLSTYNSLES